MKLYVCWGSFPMGPHTHPCHAAHQALREAGHEPEVVKAHGLAALPDAFNKTAGRQRALELTGSNQVPVLELDDGTAILESEAIIAWATAHPAVTSV